MKYKAFISYKHSEMGRMHATAVEKAIKSYPRRMFSKYMQVFRDEKHMVPDNDLSSLIKNALDNSEYLIFLAQKESANSIWCGEELEYWCNDLKRINNLIIIHISDTISIDTINNTIDWDRTEALPRFLSNHISAIPLYIDLTDTNDISQFNIDNKKYKSKIIPLIARLKNTIPEELIDEEVKIHRRNNRLKNLIIISLLFLLSSAIVATAVAWLQRKKAMENEKIALSNKKEALKQTELAIKARDSILIAQENTKIALRNEAKERTRADSNFKVSELRRVESEKKSRISRQNTHTLQVLSTDPTLALKLANHRYHSSHDKVSAKIYHDILAMNNPSYFRKVNLDNSKEVTCINMLPNGRSVAIAINNDNYSSIETVNLKTLSKKSYKSKINNIDQIEFTKDSNFMILSSYWPDGVEIFNLINTSKIYLPNISVNNIATTEDSKYLIIDRCEGIVYNLAENKIDTIKNIEIYSTSKINQDSKHNILQDEIGRPSSWDCEELSYIFGEDSDYSGELFLSRNLQYYVGYSGFDFGFNTFSYKEKKLIRKYKGIIPTDEINLCISPSSKYVITQDYDGLKFWQIESLRELELKWDLAQTKKLDFEKRNISFHLANMQYNYFDSIDQYRYQFTFVKEEESGTTKIEYHINSRVLDLGGKPQFISKPSTAQINFSNDNRVIKLLLSKKTISINLNDYSQFPTSAISISEDEKYIAIGLFDGTILIYDLKVEVLIQTLNSPIVYDYGGASPNFIHFFDNNNFIATDQRLYMTAEGILNYEVFDVSANELNSKYKL